VSAAAAPALHERKTPLNQLVAARRSPASIPAIFFSVLFIAASA